jgi:FkbH-like protein
MAYLYMGFYTPSQAGDSGTVGSSQLWAAGATLIPPRQPARVTETAISAPKPKAPDVKIHDRVFRCPPDLGVTPLHPRRIVIIGSCLASGWPAAFKTAETGCPADYILFNNYAQLAERPPQPVEDYDFQVVQLPIRSVLPDHAFFRMDYNDLAVYEKLLEDAKQRLSQFLAAAMRWNIDHGMLTFVCNFLVPQQNPMGRLLPRYDLRNFVYFVEKLNEALAEELKKYDNAHLLDIDQIVSTFGRRYFQDDAVCQSNHGAALSNADFALDQERLEPVPQMTALYSIRNHEYLLTIWNELVAMYRTLRQVDMVKLVIMDIDDTLWRGVAAEKADDVPEMAGWPLGLAEALGHLKQRGVLLAIASKNDEGLLRKLWDPIMGMHLRLEDFAAHKVNWLPKAENIKELLREVNLLPRNVLFVDDNPVERASIQAAFPEMRVMGSNPYLWRRILLWSAETQVARITAESSARTDMMRAQVEREGQRQQMSRGDFLASLSLQFAMQEIDARHERFPRALELINKTNQFNTTGKRWTEQELVAALGKGTRLLVFSVKDNFTAYGVVGVIVVKGTRIEQFVMSCRVAGMDVEVGAVAQVLKHMKGERCSAALIDTELNLLCRDLYPRCGFEKKGEDWERSLQPRLEMPEHIELVKHL